MEAAVDSVAREAWQKTTIAECPKQNIFTTYGLLEDDATEQRGVVSSTHVRDGRICSNQIDEIRQADTRRSRATLKEGDLAVVLVRRPGDAALVPIQYAGWTATRSVGIVRAKDPHIARWLRIWLQTPTAKAWIDEEVTAHVEPTLSLDSLRRMPFALPPSEVIMGYHRAISLLEEKIDLNRETALKAVELADAIHGEWSSEGAVWETRQLGAVTTARTGKGPASSLPQADGPGIDGITPTDLFDLPVPHIGRSRLRSAADASGEWAPGTLMLATRPGGAHIAMTQRPASPTRGVLAVCPLDPMDNWWLLHELRSRSSAIAGAAQGQNAREISARAFSRLSVTWPHASARARFHQVADPLHVMARKLVAESRTLYDLKDALLRDISARASVFLEEEAPESG